MVPMHAKNRKEAFHEPDLGARVCDPQQLGSQGDVLRLTEPRSVPAARFMVPMHAKNRTEAYHKVPADGL